jgi:hypothetical protein
MAEPIDFEWELFKRRCALNQKKIVDKYWEEMRALYIEAVNQLTIRENDPIDDWEWDD